MARGMRIKRNAIASAIHQAKHLLFEYGYSAQKIKDPDRVIDVCRNALGKNVDIYAGDPEDANRILHVRGYYKALDEERKNYAIYLRRPQEEEWLRFVTCKELLHVVLDVRESESCRGIHVHELVLDVVQDSYSGDIASSDEVAVEKLAEIAAMEFCFPYAERIEYFKSNSIAYGDIAKEYGLPEPVVRRYLGEKMMGLLAKYELQTGEAEPIKNY